MNKCGILYKNDNNNNNNDNENYNYNDNFDFVGKRLAGYLKDKHNNWDSNVILTFIKGLIQNGQNYRNSLNKLNGYIYRNDNEIK